MLSLLLCKGAASGCSARFAMASFITTIVSIMSLMLIVTISVAWASPRVSSSISNEPNQQQLPQVSYPHSKDSPSSISPSPSLYLPSIDQLPSSSSSTFSERNYQQNQQQIQSPSSSGFADSFQSTQSSQPSSNYDESIESNFDQVRRSFQTSHEQYSDVLSLMMKDLEQRLQQQQQQQQQSLGTSTNRLSNLDAFASMTGATSSATGSSPFGEDNSKLGSNQAADSMLGSMPSQPSSASLQYPSRPLLLPGMMPPPMGVGMHPFLSPPPPGLSPFGHRRNFLLNPFMNPAFGSEYPFFPYNPIFSKMHTNPYLFSYMPFYQAPYGPGRYFQRQQQEQSQVPEKTTTAFLSNSSGLLSNSLLSTIASFLASKGAEFSAPNILPEHSLDRTLEMAEPITSLPSGVVEALLQLFNANTNTIFDDSFEEK